ncbi:hypothetical protein GGX14DRAFT_358804 [Mycena pura]|uniref:DUF6699 domain-containing protein n=1 Tax=Mycena pura TaxID=153505 RepID=A0AAD6YED1_9AGAR|nr:hypothetical protein GGX14DRAFT_358804 [Mycena pura]
MTPIPFPTVDLRAPGWRHHAWTHCHPPTPATTPCWPAEPPPPVDSNLVVLPLDSPNWVPGTFPPQPFGTPVPLHVHPALIPNPLNPSVPPLQWDVLHASEQARLYTGRGIIKRANLSDGAVYPSAEKIWICADEENCPILAYWIDVWGPIVVERGAGARIIDVLDAVHAYFLKPLTRRDLTLVRRSKSPVNPDPIESLDRAAFRRAGDCYDLYEVAMREYKRIDVLGTFRKWGGVRPVVFMDGTWRLFLNLLPYEVPKIA